MEHLLQTGLSNALAAAVLALLATVATRVWRNPHFAYAMWLVVLLRLVAPPLLPVGLPLPQWMAELSRDADAPSRGVGHPLGPRGIPVGRVNCPAPMAGTHRLGGEDLASLASVAGSTGGPKLPPVAPETGRQKLPGRADAVRVSELVTTSPFLDDRGDPEGAPPRGSSGASKGVSSGISKAVSPSSASRWPSTASLAAAAWLSGTLCYLLLTALRVRRFARVLRQARREVPAELAADAAEVAAAVGLRREPRLAFAKAALPPMVWPGWRPVVLLPESLFTSLGAAERRLLLWHEFLHLRRRDHFVRWFEVGVVALYWWNPVAWWAVARLQQAEEDCCDAGVLVAHPDESARYGETLVSVAQFLSAGILPAPSLSVGVARNRHIKRRLTMILHGPRWPELSKTRLAAFSLLGAALVAVTWTAAKGQPTPASGAASGASPSSVAGVSPTSPPQRPKPATKTVSKATNSPRQLPAVSVSESRSVPLSKMQPLPPAPGDDELRKLQKERYNAALRELQLYEVQDEFGAPPRISEKCKASRTFYDAWKVLAKSPAEELQAVDWYVDYTNRLWKQAYNRLMVVGGTGSVPFDEAESRAARFEAQIESMKLRQSLASKSGGGTRDEILRDLKQGTAAGKRSPASATQPPAPASEKGAAHAAKAPASTLRSPAKAAQANGRALPRLLMAAYAKQIPVEPTDDEEQTLLKQRYNAAARAMDVYRQQWQGGALDLAAQMENVMAAVRNLRDAELALCPDARSKLEALGKYRDFTRWLEQAAEGWVKAGGVAGVDAPLEAARMREAVVEMELKMAQLRRELAQNDDRNPSATARAQAPRESASGVQVNGPILPRLLTAKPVVVWAGDEQVVQVRKERYNAALRLLQAFNLSRQSDPSMTVADLVTTARQVLAAQVALARPQELVGVYEGYIELMKYFESLAAPSRAGAATPAPVAYQLEATREARLEAEVKLLEARQAALNERRKQPGGATGASATGQPGATSDAKAQPTAHKGSPVPLPALLSRQPLQPQAQDDERHKLLKERYNAALRLLQASYRRHEIDPATTATNVIAAARRVLAADLALASDPVEVRERYLELMKYLEREAEARFEAHLVGRDELEAAHEARLDAELELLEAKSGKAPPAKADPSGPPAT